MSGLSWADLQVPGLPQDHELCSLVGIYGRLENLIDHF